MRLRRQVAALAGVAAAVVLLAAAACESERSEGTREAPPPAAVTTPQAPVDVVAARASASSVALAWCRYTQGPVPHWLLHEEMSSLLVPRERALLAELGAEAVAASHNFLPHERAVMRFLNRHTGCAVTTQVRQGDDAVLVAVHQRVPLIVDPRERFDLPDDASAAEHEAAWLAAFERAFADGGAYNEQPFSIRAERIEGEWYVDAQLEAHFGAPRRAEMALRGARAAVEARDWTAAASALAEGCAISPDDTRCAVLGEAVERGRVHAATTAAVREAVSVEGARVRGVVLGGSVAVPVLTATVRNDAPEAVSAVWVEVTDAQGHAGVCRLGAAAPPGDGEPLGLAAGASAVGHCRLPTALGGAVTVTVRDVLVPTLGSDPAPPAQGTMGRDDHGH